MNYVIVTVEWCLSKGIIVPESARKSVNGKMVLFHYGYIQPVLTDGDVMDVYVHDSEELRNILNSPEWSESTEKEEMT